MDPAFKNYFCPVVKYIQSEDQFIYNDSYLKRFDPSNEEEGLRGFLHSQIVALHEASLIIKIIVLKNQENLVLLKHNKQNKEYFFIFVDSSVLNNIKHQEQNAIGSQKKHYDLLASLHDNLIIVDQNCILMEVLPNCESIEGLCFNEVHNPSTDKLKRIGKGKQNEDIIIGTNKNFQRIIEIIKKVAPFDTTVLLTGESGVGKNCFAEVLHSLSPRKELPFITINCGTIPETLLESELFGYERGAFSGANINGKVGLIETANNGTLFLDEIADLPLHLQVKLLKVIQEKRITRVGGIKEKEIDFRLIVATNKDIQKLVEIGTFRKDLFYRLNVISINIPPLRKRKEDIIHFINYFLAKYNQKYMKGNVLSKKAIDRLQSYTWPGNVRELENIMERIILTAEDYIISENMLPPNILSKANTDKETVENNTLKAILNNLEMQVILEAYEKYGTTTKVGRALGISQSSVSIKLSKYEENRRKLQK